MLGVSSNSSPTWGKCTNSGNNWADRSRCIYMHKHCTELNGPSTLKRQDRQRHEMSKGFLLRKQVLKYRNRAKPNNLSGPDGWQGGSLSGRLTFLSANFKQTTTFAESRTKSLRDFQKVFIPHFSPLMLLGWKFIQFSCKSLWKVEPLWKKTNSISVQILGWLHQLKSENDDHMIHFSHLLFARDNTRNNCLHKHNTRNKVRQRNTQGICSGSM